jgi:hypothetical protein
MPCLLVFFALFTPRLVIVLLWLFDSSWFRGLFTTALWPVLGLIFLPTTFLWYTAVMRWYHGNWSSPIPIIGIVLALMIDLSPASHRRFRRRPIVVGPGE